MKIWGIGQISNEEKNDILSKHRELYNGYQTMQPQVDNTQPLFVQDFANDKGGLVVNNKGEVKPYTNMGINEQVESKEVCDECGAMEMEEHWQDGDPQYTRLDETQELCSECGGTLQEGECTECGWKGEVGDMDEGFKEWMDKPLHPKVEKTLKKVVDFFDGPEEDDEEESETEYDFEFKGKEKPKKHKVEERTGHLEDIYNVKDLNPHSEFDYVQGNDNYEGSFEQEHKMKKITNEVDDYFVDNFEDPDNEDDAIVGSDDLQIDSSEMYEQGFTGGGNAPDMDLSNIDRAYNFETDGPSKGDGPYKEKASDMDLDDEDVWEPFDFETGGPTNGGDAFPQYESQCEECYEKMESAWAEEELDEMNDISGVQGIYGAMKPAYDFDSEGPGKAGPYQRSSWNEEHDEDEMDIEDDDKRSEEDLKKFNPKDKSWSEINAFLGTDELEHLDEDLKESVVKQQTKIIDMFNRMKVIK